MIDPQRIVAAQRALGAELSRLRDAGGHTQKQLAATLLTSRSTVANIETGHHRGTRDFWERADTVLNAGGTLVHGHADVQALIRLQHEETARIAAAARAAAVQGAREIAVLHSYPVQAAYQADRQVAGRVVVGLTPEVNGRDGSPQMLLATGGRFFDGLDIEARVHPAIDDGRILAVVPAGFIHDRFLRRHSRGLVVGVTGHHDHQRAFGIDSRHARRRLGQAGLNARLIIPRAYALDHLTLGILWAVANLDDGLLHDDAVLARLSELLDDHTAAPKAVSPETLDDLSTVSRMWLGSEFCARHITRHLTGAGDPPTFWTREQRGEEASTWLLFAHKYDYLRTIADRYGTKGLSRAFCVPPDTVTASPLPERILLLLACALMESFSIAVQICPEPEYAAVDGFVLDPAGRAVVANWIGADAVWHTTVTTDRPRLRGYTDVAGYARAHSAIAANTPYGRLRAFADYLALDWTWFTARCAELAAYGVAGIAEPRSRLLSVAGLDRACHYVATLGTPGQ